MSKKGQAIASLIEELIDAKIERQKIQSKISQNNMEALQENSDFIVGLKNQIAGAF